MAWSTKVKLPSFKATQRSSSSRTLYRSIPRGRGQTIQEAFDSDTVGVCSSVANPEEVQEYENVGQNVSLHTVKEQTSASAWAQIRYLLRNTVVECSGMPSGQLCMLCSETASYRCLQCRSCAY